MNKNSIIQEVRTARAEIAAKHGYDIKRIMDDAMERQKKNAPLKKKPKAIKKAALL